MTENQRLWAEAKRQLNHAVAELGFPAELSDLLAQQLKSPRAMERMTGYLMRARPRSVEMLVDEMLAICAEQETWRRKKESQEAQAGYNAWLVSDARWQNLDEDEEQ